MVKNYVNKGDEKMSEFIQTNDKGQTLQLWKMKKGDYILLECDDPREDGNKHFWEQEKDVAWKGKTFKAITKGYGFKDEQGQKISMFVSGEKSNKTWTDKDGATKLTKLMFVVEDSYMPGEKFVLQCVSHNPDKNPLEPPTTFAFTGDTKEEII